MKVRFAPSPTGYLHIGGARTALFNYLYTKKNSGTFLLRIEDTDLKRSSKEMVTVILDGLRWLGIQWDEGPYYQSDRFQRYREAAEILVKKKMAYYCFCAPEAIESRKNQINGERQYKYDRKCLGMEEESVRQRLDSGENAVIRFRIPEGKTGFKDKIHKEMVVNNIELDDFVLFKSDGSPTYHLSVVSDDHDMGITHVIRGDDHLSNTFKQILLYRALGHSVLKFFHLPLILGQDKKKLSKRHGETSVLEFKKQGYLPEALLTYLAQLSWNPGDSKQIFTMDQLIQRIDFSKLSKNSPEFDFDKLSFLNGRAIQSCSGKALYDILKNGFEFYAHPDNGNEKVPQFIDLIKPRMKTLDSIKQKYNCYFATPRVYNQEDTKQVLPNPAIHSALSAFVEKLKALNPFNADTCERLLRAHADASGLKAADLIHPARLALTTETVSPGIFDLFEFFGRAEVIHRMTGFLKEAQKI